MAELAGEREKGMDVLLCAESRCWSGRGQRSEMRRGDVRPEARPRALDAQRRRPDGTRPVRNGRDGRTWLEAGENRVGPHWIDFGSHSILILLQRGQRSDGVFPVGAEGIEENENRA